MDFTENLVACRKKAGMTQEQLAEKLNITRQAVSKWESGQAVPDVDTAMRLCDIFGVTPNQLFLGEEKEPSADHAGKSDIVFIMSTVFLMVIFICGAAIMLYNFFNNVVFERLFHVIGVQFMAGSILAFAVMVWLKLRRERKRK